MLGILGATDLLPKIKNGAFPPTNPLHIPTDLTDTYFDFART